MSDLDLQPAGDAAMLLRLGDSIDLETCRRVQAVAGSLRRRLRAVGDVEVIAAYTSILVTYEPVTTDPKDVERAIGEAVLRPEPVTLAPRLFTLATVYGGEHGPDLPYVAEFHGITQQEAIRRHAAPTYVVYCLGFSPGFPYLGGLDPSLHTPRLDTPRRSVPVGSVAIGGGQTGVYPTSTPGGWHLIGRTPYVLFDPRRSPSVPYAPLDLIRFEPIDTATYERLREQSLFPVGETVEGKET